MLNPAQVFAITVVPGFESRKRKSATGTLEQVAEGEDDMRYISSILSKVPRVLDALTFKSSDTYWIKRYERGRTSGCGSYGRLAQYKADIVNRFVEANGITTVIEYGSGDGNQLTLAKYPAYIGFDVSPHAIARCKKLFDGDSTKAFYLMNEYAGQKADLTLSLDVVYHLVEDDVFENYMRLLFDSSRKYVVLYSTDVDARSPISPHVRHREITRWIDTRVPGWSLIQHIPNAHAQSRNPEERSKADFFIYEKIGNY